MDFKKIAVVGGGFVGSFIVVMLVMYFLFPYVNPEQVEQTETEVSMEEARYDPSKYGPKAVESLQQQILSLQQVIDSLKTREVGYVSRIDSLQDHVAEVEREKERAVSKASERVVTAGKVEGVSKSLLNLDEEALGPIINLLDDRQLVSLYNSASNMQKSKLLRSLEPEKAAKILKEVM